MYTLSLRVCSNLVTFTYPSSIKLAQNLRYLCLFNTILHGFKKTNYFKYNDLIDHRNAIIEMRYLGIGNCLKESERDSYSVSIKM